MYKNVIMKRGLFCVLCVFVCLNFAWGQRVAEEVWTDTIGYQQWQARWSEKDDTVWFVNFPLAKWRIRPVFLFNISSPN